MRDEYTKAKQVILDRMREADRKNYSNLTNSTRTGFNLAINDLVNTLLEYDTFSSFRYILSLDVFDGTGLPLLSNCYRDIALRKEIKRDCLLDGFDSDRRPAIYYRITDITSSANCPANESNNATDRDLQFNTFYPIIIDNMEPMVICNDSIHTSLFAKYSDLNGNSTRDMYLNAIRKIINTIEVSSDQH